MKKKKRRLTKLERTEKYLVTYKKLTDELRRHSQEEFKRHQEFRKVCSEFYNFVANSSGTVSIGFASYEDATLIKKSYWVKRLEALWK